MRSGAIPIALALAGCAACDAEIPAPAENCATLVDEDGDGARACDDPDCLQAGVCQIAWSTLSEVQVGAAMVPQYGVEGDDREGHVQTSLTGPWADMNGDGIPDGLAVIECYSDYVTLGCTPDLGPLVEIHFLDGAQLLAQPLHQLGDETAIFSVTIPEDEFYDNGPDPYYRGSYAVTDLDGDGHDDLVAAQPAGHSAPSIHVWMGDPDGLQMPRGPDFQVNGSYNRATVHRLGDLDGDGRGDLALVGGTASTSEVGIVYGAEDIGILHFSEVGIAARVSGTGGMGSMPAVVDDAGDLTGDGLDDLLVVTSSLGALPDPVPETCATTDLFTTFQQLAVFSGATIGLGSVSLADADAVLCVPRHYFSTRSTDVVATGDLDGDGYRDIVVADENTYHHGAYESGPDDVRGIVQVVPGSADGWGTGNLERSIFLVSPTGTTDAEYGELVTVGDLDGDGVDDAVVRYTSYSPLPAGMYDHFCDLYPKDDMGIVFMVYLGRIGAFDSSLRTRFPDYVVLGGECGNEGFEGVELSAGLVYGSLQAVQDVDGDGATDWVGTKSSWVNVDDEGDTCLKGSVVNVYANRWAEAHPPR